MDPQAPSPPISFLVSRLHKLIWKLGCFWNNKLLPSRLYIFSFLSSSPARAPLLYSSWHERMCFGDCQSKTMLELRSRFLESREGKVSKPKKGKITFSSLSLFYSQESTPKSGYRRVSIKEQEEPKWIEGKGESLIPEQSSAWVVCAD